MQPAKYFVRAATLAAAIMATAGCGRDDPPKPNLPEEITILCGSSFRPPMEKLVKLYEEQTGGRAVLAFGGSEVHLPKIRMHAVGDVFVTHTPYIQYTEDAGALLRDVQVGHLAPVLVVKKGNPKNIRRIEDLTTEGLRVVLPNPEFSTCGEMVFGLLQKKGLKDQVLANVGNALVRQHAEVAGPIKLDHRDAGIMWNGVAHDWLDAIEIIPGPYEYKKKIRVAVMGLSYSRKKDLAKEFLDFVEKHGKEVFSEFGYVKCAE